MAMTAGRRRRGGIWRLGCNRRDPHRQKNSRRETCGHRPLHSGRAV